MHEPQPSQNPPAPKSECRIPGGLFESMARWYFGGSFEKEPPTETLVGETVTLSDAWLGILCLSYYGNGPRHPSVNSSGGLHEGVVSPQETVKQYAPVKERFRLVPGGYAARKVTNGNRPDQAHEGSDGAGEDHRRPRGARDEPVVVPESDLAGGSVLPAGGEAV